MKLLNDLYDLVKTTQLTPNQLLGLWLISNADQGKISHLKTTVPKPFITTDELDDLKRRHFVVVEGGGYTVKKLPKIFEGDVENRLVEYGKRFYETYPNFIRNNGKTLPLKNCTYTEFLKGYNTVVTTEVEAIELEKDLAYAMENELIVVKILNFIANIYLQVREERLNEEATTLNQNPVNNEF